MEHQAYDIVAFGAHAADVEFSCGAVLAKHVQRGDRAMIVHFTLGEAGHPAMEVDAYARQKEAECREAAAVLGAEVRVLPYRDGALPATPEVELAVCDLIRELRPRVVLTHCMGSFHRDHVLSHHLVMQGLSLARSPQCDRSLPSHSAEVVLFPDNWEDSQGFRPEVYVDVSDSYGTWLKAAAKYGLWRGEVVSFPYRSYYEALSLVRGAETQCGRAVALMRSSEVWKTARSYLL